MLIGPADRLAAELLVDEWLKNDFDKATRREVCALLSERKFDEIQARLSGKKKMVFGTAGLRARMGAGFDRMNCLTVLQTTQGLAEFCIKSAKLENRTVIIGFDGRHNSESFAHVAAAVFIAKNFKVFLIEKPAPTPFTPFLVPLVNASCGVQITASHNPKSDNGYKLFWSNGAQIIPPIDAGVAACIERCRDVDLSVFKILDPATLRLKPEITSDKSKIELHFAEVSSLYVEKISRQLAASTLKPNVSFAYTAMHGVGYEPFTKLANAFFGEEFSGAKVICPVSSQVEIDAEFPTVAFPNPEEKGALKLAIADAETNGCKYVLANDPDADRFTAAERQPDGTWYQFTGDELGLLFADYQIEQNRESEGLIVSSVVSSQMVRSLCTVRSVEYGDCLTGFKWIANESISRREKDKNLVHLLGYEEAIGYQLSDQVADKDGLSAACVFMQMTAARGQELMKDRIANIQANEIGFFVTNNGYFIIDDPDTTKAIFGEFRASGMKQLGTFEIVSVRDVTRGTDSSTVGGASHLPATPEAEMIQMFFKNGAVVTVRASGTEPKVKFYAEMASKVSAEDAKQQLDQLVATIKKDFYQPHKYSMREQPIM